jgi:hypothetical protein
MTPLIFEPERLTTAELEKDYALKLEGSASPPCPKCNLAVIGRKANQYGWNESAQGYACVINHGPQR